MTRANMSTVTNEGVEIHWKSVKKQLFTVLIVGLGTSTVKYKGSIEAYPSIR